MNHLSSFLFRVLVIACFVISLPRSNAQQQGHSIGLQPPYEQNTLSASTTLAQQEKALRAANAERQKQLVKDSAKLIELTDKLKKRWDEQGSQKVTDDDLKLLAQIEKLAHNIREKMAYAGELTPPPTPQPLLTF